MLMHTTLVVHQHFYLVLTLVLRQPVIFANLVQLITLKKNQCSFFFGIDILGSRHVPKSKANIEFQEQLRFINGLS
jgi:hypothetical protein